MLYDIYLKSVANIMSGLGKSLLAHKTVGVLFNAYDIMILYTI